MSRIFPLELLTAMAENSVPASSSDCTFGKPWLKSYPPGIPEQVDLGTYDSLVDLLEQGFEQYGPRVAYENFGKTLTYAEIEQQSRAFAAWLQQGLKLQKGDRVAVMMPNLLQYPIAVFGILRAGCVVVNTNPLYTPRELKHQLTDSGAKAIVIVENFAHVLEAVIGETEVEHVMVTSIGEMLGAFKGRVINFALRKVKKAVPPWSLPGHVRFGDTLSQGRKLSYQRPALNQDDLAFLQYTGGTTGVAKGAMLTHRNLIANVLQAGGWLQTITHGDETIITALPLYHIFALTANCLVFFTLGGRNVLVTNPRDMKAFVKLLAKTPFTAITGVNTLFNGLLNTPGFENIDFSKLHLTLGGGMAVQRAVAERWKAVTGCTLVEAYGLTETSPAACMNPMNLADYNGSIGLPIPSTDASVQNEEGQCLPPGETGELCIRGPQVMKGYWNRPEETAKVLDEHGWLKTGDIARWDEQGYFYIVDRKKDMILVSGFNVYPNEIEDVAVMMPDIVEAAAIGMPDEHSGEVVRLCVVSKNPALTEAEVIEFMRQHLTGYKVPKKVSFHQELPKTNVGKILRRELREQCKD